MTALTEASTDLRQDCVFDIVGRQTRSAVMIAQKTDYAEGYLDGGSPPSHLPEPSYDHDYASPLARGITTELVSAS